MNVTIRVRGFVEAQPALVALSERKLKVAASFWLARLTRQLAPDMATFIKERDALIVLHGEETAPGSGAHKVKPSEMAAYGVAVGELLDVPMTLAIEPRTVASLGLEEIEPWVLSALWFLFTDEAPAEAAGEKTAT